MQISIMGVAQKANMDSIENR